jgi:hypothetical protein
MEQIERKISETESRLHIVIPAVYREFLLAGRDMQFDDGILYDIDAIAERYVTLEFAEYAPELIPIGNDNGDCELVMRSGSSTKTFGFLEQGAIGTAKPAHMQSFAKWYENGHSFSQEKQDVTDWSARVQVILVKCPENKAKTMLKIRKALRLETPVSALLAAAEHTPCVLTDQLTAAAAKTIIEQEQLECWLRIRF